MGEIYTDISSNLSQLQQHKEAAQFAGKAHDIFKQSLNRVLAQSMVKVDTHEEDTTKGVNSSNSQGSVTKNAEQTLQLLLMESFYQHGQCILRLNQHKEALKIFSEGYHESNAILGRNHDCTLRLRDKVKLLSRYKSQGTTQYAMRDKSFALPALSPISLGPVVNMDLKPVKSPPLSRQSSINKRESQPSPELSLINEHSSKRQHMVLRQRNSQATAKSQEKNQSLARQNTRSVREHPSPKHSPNQSILNAGNPTLATG